MKKLILVTSTEAFDVQKLEELLRFLNVGVCMKEVKPAKVKPRYCKCSRNHIQLRNVLMMNADEAKQFCPYCGVKIKKGG